MKKTLDFNSCAKTGFPGKFNGAKNSFHFFAFPRFNVGVSQRFGASPGFFA